MKLIQTSYQNDFRIFLLICCAGLIIGSCSFAGSIIAWGKLNGKVKIFLLKDSTIQYFRIAGDPGPGKLPVLDALPRRRKDDILFDFRLLSLLYGVLFVMPIGGADMPVVISLLNSFTGVAAACGGFLYDNKVMLTGGILVGAAGTLLTILMCKAMNRSLTNVLIGSFGAKTHGDCSR